MFAGDVPLDMKIRQSCDQGSPVALLSTEENDAIVSIIFSFIIDLLTSFTGNDLHKDQ